MSGRGNGVWSLAGEIILRNYKSWKVEWRPLEIKLWLFRVITWHFCLSLFSSDRVQSTKQMTAQWRFVFTPHSCLSSGVTGELYSKQNSSLNSTLINKSSFFICPLTARTPRTFLQINCGWFLIPAVIVIDSEITEEKAYKLLSDRVEEGEAALKHPDFNIGGGGWTELVCQWGR